MGHPVVCYPTNYSTCLFASINPICHFSFNLQIYLKRKNTCHTGVGHAAGWIIPMAWLIANERVRDYGCNSVRAAAEYFNKACAPGARSPYFQNRSVEL